MIGNLQIADDIPLPIILLDPNALTLDWINQSGQSWLGSSVKTLQGKSIEDIFSHSEELSEAFEKTQAQQVSVRVHDLVVRPRGRDEVKCELVTFHHDSRVGLCFRHVGRQTQKIDVFGDGASALGRLLAHEIKNPLAGIQGAAQLLRDDIQSEEAGDLLSLIESEIARIRRLADRMERLGDVTVSEFAELNIHEILRHGRKVLQSGLPDHISFTEHYDPSLPNTLGDEDSLTQAVMNLIKNAAEAFPEDHVNPEIRLETSYRATGTSQPIEIRIIDNGSGIPDHVRDRIFQPFITHKPGGQGLGLALVSKVIAAHNGLIEVRSRPGQTIFSILLPSAERNAS
ncbi:MAG: hypothetical protein HKN36_01875 [Hellea sp.]|nr:hypothetical protein [Hellea sp.]